MTSILNFIVHDSELLFMYLVYNVSYNLSSICHIALAFIILPSQSWFFTYTSFPSKPCSSCVIYFYAYTQVVLFPFFAWKNPYLPFQSQFKWHPLWEGFCQMQLSLEVFPASYRWHIRVSKVFKSNYLFIQSCAI